MAAPGDKDLTFTIHGLDAMGDEVYFDVFVGKVQALLRGLRDLDKTLNGGKRFDYVVADLQRGSTVVAIREKPATLKRANFSPSRSLGELGEQFVSGSAQHTAAEASAARLFGSLCGSVQKRFDHGTLVSESTGTIIRIDRFLEKRVASYVEGQLQAVLTELFTPEYFHGTVWGAFTGSILEIDARNLRSLLPAGHFILDAGGRDIECIFHDVEEVSRFFRKRVVIEGNAFYDGMSGLPARIDVYKIRPVSGTYKDFLERPSVPGFDLEDFE